MAFTDRLRQQHDQAATAAQQLRCLVGDHRPGGDALAITIQLARLFSGLRAHLAEEERCLYPALTATNDCSAAELAEQDHQEAGSLAWDWEEFMRRWSSSALIASSFASFEASLDRLLGALEARIACEEATLFPVADALFPDRQDKAA